MVLIDDVLLPSVDLRTTSLILTPRRVSVAASLTKGSIYTDPILVDLSFTSSSLLIPLTLFTAFAHVSLRCRDHRRPLEEVRGALYP
jgi:hypothetical protein